MSPVTELLAFFEKTLTDGRFSRGEQQAIRQRLSDGNLNERQLANLRSRLFKMAKTQARSAKAQNAFAWLESALKTIPATRSASASATAKVFFSPGDKCLKAINGLLGLAKLKVDICVFTITDNRIADAIIRTHQRGVKVRIISDNDKAHDAGSDIHRLKQSGIPLRTDKTPDHMHHKFALIDGNTALTGSYNWTRSAAAVNFENLLVTDDSNVVKPYQREFDRLWRSL
jgi:mitochondrial cardiolipin hydrolase